MKFPFPSEEFLRKLEGHTISGVNLSTLAGEDFLMEICFTDKTCLRISTYSDPKSWIEMDRLV